jgi:hypothetical protein
MALKTINTDLVRVALDKADGWSFEHFINDFYASIGGESYSPLGGLKDGGADAYDGGIYESRRDASVFYQSSVAKDHEAKIRKTVVRLREFGRQPSRLVYFTTQAVRYTDRVEAELSDELDVTVTIRDGGYIASQPGRSPRSTSICARRLTS